MEEFTEETIADLHLDRPNAARSAEAPVSAAAVATTAPSVATAVPPASSSSVSGSGSAAGDERPPIEVRLESPEKTGEGLSTHVEYCMVVKVHASSPPFREGEYRGMRRYKDFLALREQLCDLHRGHLIPPLPEKQLINRFSVEFLEYRRRELERFLHRVLAHPLLRTSPALPVFFEAQSSEALAAWQSSHGKDVAAAGGAAGDGRDRTASSSGGGGGGGMFSSISSSLFGHSLATVVGPTAFALKEPDPYFEARKTALQQQEHGLDRLHKALGAVLRRRKELIAAEAEFAAAAALMSASEAEQSAWLAGTWDRLADVSTQLCRIDEQRVDASSTQFEDEMRDGLRMLGAVREMLQVRDERLSAFQQAERTLDAKRDKLLKAPSTKLDREVHEAERKVEETRTAFTQLSDTVRRELQAFESAKLHDSKRILLAHIQNELNSSLQISDAWRNFLLKVEQIE